MSRSIPDRWLPYKPYGEVIKGTKIVAFKVPLKESVARNLQPDQRFTPKMLLEAIPRMKHVIDLTNTHRYYDQREFTDAGIKHLKILVPGRLVPPTEHVKRFFKAMDDFMATSEADELIGVHCTHGVNRTGYFICRYLIQQLGWESQNAITAFEEARGYPIERDVFVNDLKVTPKGEKLDTSEINLSDPVMPIRGHRIPKRHNPMGPPGFHPSRRGFPNGRPFPPQHEHFGFGPPAFNPPMPPRPPRPPMPPPHGVPYGPRPHRYGPPPGRFPNVGFPPRMPPGPPRMPMPGGPPRLPGPPGPPGPLGPPGPPSHVGPNWLPPSHPMGPRGPPGPGPRLPHGPPKPMPPLMKGGGSMRNPRKKWDPQNAVVVRNMAIKRINKPIETPVPVHIDDFIRDQDFTADTFEENLTAGVIPGDRVPAALMTGPRRRNKGRFNNRASRGE